MNDFPTLTGGATAAVRTLTTKRDLMIITIYGSVRNADTKTASLQTTSTNPTKTICIRETMIKEGAVMIRKVRSDCTVGAFEKSRGLPPGTVRNPNGRDTRSDKRIGTIRKEASKGKR